MNLPKTINSGEWTEGHVQGIAVDTKKGYIYYSFTTILLKTDLLGNPIGSAIRLAGHLGCITFNEDDGKVYGSLELKHDVIGRGIISRTGWNPSDEDSFYLVCFDVDKIIKMNMDSEKDGIMTAVYLKDVVADYEGTDEVSGVKHRYGCSGIDGTAYGPVFGAAPDSPKKFMIAYGIYSDISRNDNDYQVILQYDPSIFEQYAKPLNQESPHHSGPESCENKYFLYTGNTTFGIQNIEYDASSRNWFIAVYVGKKECFTNFHMFVCDGTIAPIEQELVGRNGEKGLTLTLKKIGVKSDKNDIYGSDFLLGSTGIASIGNGYFYISKPYERRDDSGHYLGSLVSLYKFDENDPLLFKLA